MDIYTIDYETFFSSDFTLSTMTTEAYVRDERFEVHGCAIRDPSGVTFWLDDAQFWEWSSEVDWSTTAILCHHVHFDGLILSHRYGIKPALYLDTLSMARALLGTHISKSLESLAKEFGLRAKTIDYLSFKGKHWHDLSPAVRDQVARGACHDVSLTWDIFGQLAKSFPAEEYQLVDATVRMFTDPVLEGDTELLGRIWTEEQARKKAMLTELGVTETDIRKNHVFAKLLREHGVEPEQKRMKDANCKDCMYDGQSRGAHLDDSECQTCSGKGFLLRWKYSFAKTDDFMRDLLDGEQGEDAQLLAEAKLAAHSTGTQTRTMRLGWMSTRGPMPVYLNYCGTHLKGWSGGDKVNWQNFRRGGPIAKAIQAPKGHMVVVVDSSQCECRLLETVAGEDLTDWRAGKDPYISLASKFYGEEIYKPAKGDPRQAEMEEKRGTGKQLRLSCGYGAGGPKIKWTAKAGIYGPPVYLTDDQALQARDLYRSEKPRVPMLWKDGGDVLKKMHAGLEFEWHCVYIKDKRMWFPNGLPAIYETLKWEDDPDDGGDAGWRVRVNKNGWSKMYGSKFIENLIQGLRNVLVRQAWLRCRQAGIHMVSNEHDKLVAVVREQDAEDAFRLMREEMCCPPTWLPSVPLDSEGYISETFAKPEK